MAGAYSHITFAKLIPQQAQFKILPKKAIDAISSYSHFFELGAVSPDYPLLDITSKVSEHWSDLMHYQNTGDFTRTGAKLLKRYKALDKPKLFAWLAGYLTHYTLDLFVHPIVEILVGPYEKNRIEHRRCEMHQDVYIVKTLLNKAFSAAEFIDHGIKKCSDPLNSSVIDQTIKFFWHSIFESIYKQDFDSQPPDIDKWHNRYIFLIDNIAEEASSIPVFGSALFEHHGLSYPKADDVKQKFIGPFYGPHKQQTHFLSLFRNALPVVLENLTHLAEFIYGSRSSLDELFPNANMGTGQIEDGNFVYWAP